MVIKRWRLEVNTCCVLKTILSPNNSTLFLKVHSFLQAYRFTSFNMFIASSSSHADRYLLFDQTKHAKFGREVSSLTSFNKTSRIFLHFHK